MIFEKKVVLISGAASGIGKSTAIQFLEQGARVLLIDLDRQKLENTVQSLKDFEPFFQYFCADVSDSKQVEKAVNFCIEKFGRMDVLVSNAAINPRGTVLTTPDSLLDKILSVNLKATFYLCKFCVPHMKSEGGSIVTISSINGLVAWENEAAYDASKGGLIMLTKAVAVDFAKFGIRANCICPGITDTPMLRRTASSKDDPEKFMEEVNNMQPLPRIAQPEDIANATLFLASDRAAYITGVVLPVDGGYTAV